MEQDPTEFFSLTEEMINSIKKDVLIRYNENNFYTELKENEIFRERLMTLRDAEQYNGKYFSTDYIKKNILRQTNADVQRITMENMQEYQQANQINSSEQEE